MISLLFIVNNPWGKNNFKNIFNTHRSITKNKTWEFEILRDQCIFFEFNFRYTTKQDHAGPSLKLGLFGYNIAMFVYDNRHWDYYRKCWVI